MAEKNQVQQVTKEPQQVTKEPQGKARQEQRVTTKNLKKVEVGKRLAEHNHKKREAKKREEQAQLEKSGVNQYYGMGLLRDPRPAGPIRAVIALGVIGDLGYYIYRSNKGEIPNRALQAPALQNPPQQPCLQVQLQTNKFEMD